MGGRVDGWIKLTTILRLLMGKVSVRGKEVLDAGKARVVGILFDGLVIASDYCDIAVVVIFGSVARGTRHPSLSAGVGNKRRVPVPAPSMQKELT